MCGAGGPRTHDPGIMSTLALNAVLTCEDAGRVRARRVEYSSSVAVSLGTTAPHALSGSRAQGAEDHTEAEASTG
jgi:hypothetical protein